jgi:hypothetical protein
MTEVIRLSANGQGTIPMPSSVTASERKKTDEGTMTSSLEHQSKPAAVVDPPDAQNRPHPDKVRN